MMNMKINKNRPIGKVIYVVEGEKTEVELLKQIFTSIFSFTFIEKKKNGESVLCLKKGATRKSQIYVIVSKRPQIVGLKRDVSYLENVYNQLNYDFALEPDEAAVYYLFDRDRDSNSKGVVKELLKKLVSSRDNPLYNMNGMLLLSYPCIESFIFNAFENESKHSCGREIKKDAYDKKYFIEKISEDDLIKATSLMLKLIKRIRKKDIQEFELDNISNISISVFNYEEKEFFYNKYYLTLSLIGLSLLDLGLIESL